jgi:hypothetical protein
MVLESLFNMVQFLAVNESVPAEFDSRYLLLVLLVVFELKRKAFGLGQLVKLANTVADFL